MGNKTTPMTTAELAMPQNHLNNNNDTPFQRKSEASTPDEDDIGGNENDVSGEIVAGERMQWPRKIVMKTSSETEPDEIEDSAASDF